MAKMKDCLIKRGNKWAFVVRERDPLTGEARPRWYSGFDTRADAARARDEKRVEIAARRNLSRANPTLADFLAQWLDQVDVKPKTLGFYRYNVERYVSPRIGSVQLQEITPAQLTCFYAELHRSGGRASAPLGHASIRAIHRTLSSALTAACRSQLLHVNPATFAVLPRKPVVNVRETPAPGVLHRVFDARELMQFLDAAAGHRLGALFWLAAYTGARRGELLFLRWSDLSFDDGMLGIYGTRGFADGDVREGTPKGGRSRIISIDEQSLEVMRGHRKAQNEERLKAGPFWLGTEDYIFVTERGLPIHPDTPSKLMASLCGLAGVSRLRFHDLRHTHATLLLSSGHAPHEVADRLGHADATITLKTYATALAERRTGMGESFAQIVRSVGSTI